jgi:predicted transposase/invertase (TIGR01784 family)
MFPFINPKTDFAFKKIFGSPQSKGILISFLNALLYEGTSTIQDLTIIDPYQAPRIEGIKDSYLDVKAKLVDGQTVIIEMQVLNVLGFKKRVLYNAAKAFSTQLEVGDDYTLLNPVIALTITDFEMFEHSEQVVSRYRLKEKNALSDYSDDIELVFAELPKFTLGLDELTTLTDKWLYFLKEANHLEAVPDSLDQESAIHDAFEVARQSRLTRQEMETLDRQAMFIHDSRNAVRLGQAVGIEQGIAQGIAQGRVEGLEEGIEVGERNAKVEIARSLLNRLSVEEISQITGLSPLEVEQLIASA